MDKALFLEKHAAVTNFTGVHQDHGTWLAITHNDGQVDALECVNDVWSYWTNVSVHTGNNGVKGYWVTDETPCLEENSLDELFIHFEHSALLGGSIGF